jgi:histone acetyltransferase (RNA polymerase elongator complex component)
MKTHYIIPVFVPFAGCPNKCTFCNQTRISGVDKLPTGTDVQQLMTEYLATMPKERPITIEVAYYGGSFTGIPKAQQQELLTPAAEAKAAGLIQHIRLSTRADYIDKDVLGFLKEFRVDIIELGVQSLDDIVLELAQRGHGSREVFKAVELIKEHGFSLGIQLMVGLPGDKLTTFLKTIEETIRLKPDFVRIYPTLVIENTELADAYRQGSFQPLTLDEAVDYCKLALIEFKKADLPVIRIGLQPTDEINTDMVLAGPFHPSFRELVEAAVMRDKITTGIKKLLSDTDLLKDIAWQKDKVLADTVDNLPEKRKILLRINSRDHSIVRGQKNKNIEYFKEVFPFLHIEISNDSSLDRGEFRIN